MKAAKIILLCDVASVGRQYEVKEVAVGFARNFLLPRGLAVIADEQRLKQTETRKRQRDQVLQRRRVAVGKIVKELDGTTLTIKTKANEQGHLFAAVHEDNLLRELKEQKGVNLEAGLIQLAEPLKAVGEYLIPVKFGEELAECKVQIEAQN